MSHSGGKIRGKILATQKWLSRAEEHFDRNASARGEMDLLLAEAELRSTRENLQAHPHRLKLSLFQQGMAFGLAAIAVAFGAGAAWWWQPDRTESIPQALSVAVPIRQAQAQDISTVPLPKRENAPAAAVDSTIPEREVKNVDKSTIREPSVSQEEMQRLVQTAGQSLRRRTKP